MTEGWGGWFGDDDDQPEEPTSIRKQAMTIEVTRADREAAELFVANDYSKGDGFSDGYWIRKGEYDEHPLIQAFARHRTESIDAYLEALITNLPDSAVEAGVGAITPEAEWDFDGQDVRRAARAAITAALTSIKEISRDA